MESQVKRIQGRRDRSPDGSEQYLVDEALLGSTAERLGGELADPLKTWNGELRPSPAQSQAAAYSGALVGGVTPFSLR
jgi:hypothetical protein